MIASLRAAWVALEQAALESADPLDPTRLDPTATLAADAAKATYTAARHAARHAALPKIEDLDF